MALTLKFIDGCNHLATAQLNRKYSVVASGATITTGGRNGDNVLSITGSPFANSVALDAQPCVMAMFAFKVGGFADLALVRFYDTATLHAELRMDVMGKLVVCRNGTSLADSGAVTLLTNTWYHIGFAAKIDDSGSYDVWLNGVKLITGTGDTRNAGNASANLVKLGPGASTASPFLYGDIAVYNGASYTDSDFPGDCRVMTSLPTGAGNYSQWTGTYAEVDDATPDDDDTTISDATPGNISTFTMTPIAGTGTVKGVQLNLMARKDDAGARTIASVARLGTTDAVGSTVATGLTFVDYMTQLPTKPGGGAWTVDDVNACEFGIKTIS